MKIFKFKNCLLLILLITVTSSCVTLQQPLPGSLWGNWAIIQTGTIINGSNERLVNYINLCSKQQDRLEFRSDNKMSLRWYERGCTIGHYPLGKYHVEGNTIKIDLADPSFNPKRPFPPIKEFRIIQINSTTLKIEEIPDEARQQRHRGKSNGPEAIVYVLMRID